jgi:dipeptidase E
MLDSDLLLNSSSSFHGYGYMDHVQAAVQELFASAPEVLFIPWALHDPDKYTKTVADRFHRMGLRLRGIHEAADPVKAVEDAAGIFIGGGNTFRLLSRLYEAAVIQPIRERVLAGMPYMGSSAGSNVACPTIKTTNDMPIVEPPGFDALGLVSFQINPHYTDPDPTSTHRGETREERIREYLEMNMIPVVGLREGAWLRVRGDEVTLGGHTPARIFRRDRAPEEVRPETVLTLWT